MYHQLAGIKSEIEHQFEAYGVREIDEVELASIDDARSEMRRFEAGQFLFEMCQDNFDDFMDLIDNISNLIKDKSFNRAVIIRQSNRRILNFLASFSSFIDHWEKKLVNIKQQHNKDYTDEFRILTAYHYDTYFAYRFLCHLRNYTLHYAMPIQDFSIVTDKDNPEPEISIGLRTVLLTNGSFKWKKLYDEIINSPPFIDILPLIKQLMLCINDINLFLQDIDLDIISDRWTMLSELCFEVYRADATLSPIILSYDTNVPKQITPLPMDVMKRVYDLKRAKGVPAPTVATQLPTP